MSKRNIDTAFFGQPKGLSTLFFTEMWERFSYYGMRAILLFYMYYAVTKGGLGMNQVTAASVMSIYGSLVYLSNIVGGWLSDRLWGSRKTVFIGGVLIMIGHIVLSLPMGLVALYVSIALIVAGTGLLKPNVSDMVGGLYSANDRRRDAGFSMFVFGINLGSAIAPWAVPWAANGFGLHLFGNEMNFHAGFSLAAIGMFFGLVQYYIGGKKYLSDDSLMPTNPIDHKGLVKVGKKTIIGLVVVAILLGILAIMGQLNINNIIGLITIVAILLPICCFWTMLRSPKVTKIEHSRVLAYIPLFIAAAIFWGIEESGSVVLALFAQDRTILHIGGWHFAAANFQTLNPLFIMILTPFFVRLWEHWKRQPSAPGKFAWGLVFAGLSYVWMAIPGTLYGTSGRVSPFWLVGSWFIVEIAEMLISPIGLSVTTKLAPNVYRSEMMSMWFLADAAGQAINSQIVKYYSASTEIPYFLVIGGVSILFGILMFFLVKRINVLMDGVH
ncbi:peptide MFS transporter [Lactobacillus acetotolerans]|uniref:Peptide MFS transporter n=1 Tax=Lactobacillus acetotolerans TaxID=1600 RepID=A0A5P5ZK69_9LACO|nr:peptide MFS transporter [Lactobacillus acetotolerans]KRN36639.1 di-tripeptide transporter [Lactobacillus acetotolerans DSM 20749 = JCM 3825]QFG51854.1 peptide MFS transporter [Lactobacillus acetotolerans]GGV18993.1 MFS transporter [Lactobacillus acetotolerans DSM 20749 = JCM 3825]